MIYQILLAFHFCLGLRLKNSSFAFMSTWWQSRTSSSRFLSKRAERTSDRKMRRSFSPHFCSPRRDRSFPRTLRALGSESTATRARTSRSASSLTSTTVADLVDCMTVWTNRRSTSPSAWIVVHLDSSSLSPSRLINLRLFSLFANYGTIKIYMTVCTRPSPVSTVLWKRHWKMPFN